MEVNLGKMKCKECKVYLVTDKEYSNGISFKCPQCNQEKAGIFTSEYVYSSIGDKFKPEKLT